MYWSTLICWQYSKFTLKIFTCSIILVLLTGLEFDRVNLFIISSCCFVNEPPFSWKEKYLCCYSIVSFSQHYKKTNACFFKLKLPVSFVKTSVWPLLCLIQPDQNIYIYIYILELIMRERKNMHDIPCHQDELWTLMNSSQSVLAV